MALEEMQERIIQDAKAKAAEIKAQAEKERTAILEEAKTHAKEIIERAKNEAKKRADAILKEHKAAFEVERHNMELMAQEEAIKAELPAIMKLVEKKLEASYAKIIEQAAKSMKELGVEFFIMAGHTEKKLVEGKGYEVKEGGNGIKVLSKDMKISISISPNEIIEKHVDIIKREIAKELFKNEKEILEKVEKGQKTARKHSKASKPKIANKKKAKRK